MSSSFGHQTYRYPGLDIARAAAIFLVVLHHAWTMMGGEMGQSSAIGLFYANVEMNVPLFVMISGALQMTPRPAMEYWKKRFPRVWVPYLFWGTCVYVISYVMGKYPEINSTGDAAGSFVPYMLDFGKVNAAYWFIGLISFLYLVTPLLHLFIPRMSKKGLLALVGVWLVWMLLKDIFHISSLPLSFDKYLGYYVAGFAFRTFFGKGGGAVGMAAFVLATIALTVIRGSGQVSGVLLFVQTAGLYVALGSLKRCPKCVDAVSGHAFFIYLTHFVLLGVTYAALPSVDVPSLAAWILPLALTFTVIALECAIASLLCRLKPVPKILFQ